MAYNVYIYQGLGWGTTPLQLVHGVLCRRPTLLGPIKAKLNVEMEQRLQKIALTDIYLSSKFIIDRFLLLIAFE